MFGFPRGLLFDPFDAWFDRRFGPRENFFISDPFDDLARAMEATSRRMQRERRRAQHGHQPQPQTSNAQIALDKVHHNDAVRPLSSAEEEADRAWREHHEELARASVIPQATPEEKVASKAWEEYHSEMDRAREVIEPRQQELMESFMRAPRCHIVPREDNFTLVVDVPGCRKEDVKVQLGHDNAGHFVTITGERKMESTSEGPHFTHRQVYGSFTRTVRLPSNVSVDPASLNATYENGCLKIKLPKRKDQPKPAGVSIPIA